MWVVENTTRNGMLRHPKMGVENEVKKHPRKQGAFHAVSGVSGAPARGVILDPLLGGQKDPPFWGGGDILNNVNFGGIHRS